MKNYLLLCGGVGGAKLALGFKNSIDPMNLTIVVNTGDDFTHLDFKICPDLDTVMYTLAGESDASKGWGRKDESWNMLSALGEMNGETWFQLGDKDLATHIQRTHLMKSGLSLTGRFLGGEVGLLSFSKKGMSKKLTTIEAFL